ncbi:HET-domain-containing protein, partial [Polychaeton citri CBS 116435]
MRLLNTNLEFCDYDDTPPPYAILSHTWSEKNEEEVTYQDLENGTTKSLLKLELCKEWTKAASLEYFWIDTCCIDKRNDAEISYAIRSMWRWYREASVCFVYLSDLSRKRKLDSDWRDTLKDCTWFTRGWTLQELVASQKVELYARDGHLGSREDLLPALKRITGINLGGPLPDHATRLSWAARRITKRPEDKAYCMLGICDVSLDPRYGEGGESAWQRL